MTQQEQHAEILAKVIEVSQAVNAAAQRVATAVEAASGKATVDDADILSQLDSLKTTADNIALPEVLPAPAVTE